MSLSITGGWIAVTLLRLGTYALGSKGTTKVNGDARNHSVYVEWGSSTTGGQVVVEEASNDLYAGTWVNLTTFDWSAGGRADVWSGTRAIGAIRTRITSAITGGQGTDNGGVKTSYLGN